MSNAELMHTVESWFSRNAEFYETATELAEAAFAEFPTLDLDEGFELAHEAKYPD